MAVPHVSPITYVQAALQLATDLMGGMAAGFWHAVRQADVLNLQS